MLDKAFRSASAAAVWARSASCVGSITDLGWFGNLLVCFYNSDSLSQPARQKYFALRGVGYLHARDAVLFELDSEESNS